MKARPVSVVLADDHPVLLGGLRSLIESNAAFNVVAECVDGNAALSAIRHHAPAIAILDLQMPRLSGLNVLAEIARERLRTRVVLMAATIRDAEIQAAVEAGAYSIMLKETAPDAILDCLKKVAVGGRALPEDLVAPALEREKKRREFADRIRARLTTRERQIALLAAEGFSSKELAHRLKLTEGTVKLHLHNVFSKLDVTRRENLVTIVNTVRDRLERRHDADPVRGRDGPNAGERGASVGRQLRDEAVVAEAPKIGTSARLV